MLRLTPSQRVYFTNVAAHSGGLYGGKALDLLILGAVTRAVPASVIGTVFLADAIGGAIFRLADFGLFPVLFRRAAREQVGPELLLAATLARAAGALLLTVPFLLVAFHEFPEKWKIAAAFFIFAGLYVVHEVPRAVLAGRERFKLTASVGILTKCVEAALTLTGLSLGEGVWAWALGRCASQVGMLAGTYLYARRSVVDFPSVKTRDAFREGLPFWFASATTSALGQLDTIVVGTYLGMVETAELGIASRVTGSLMSFVGSLTNVAFPEMARKNRRFAALSQVRGIVVVAIGLSLALFIAAPLIIRIVTGRFDADGTLVLRAMSPALAFAALNRAQSAWLQAKNKERAMAAVNVAASALSASALFVLVPLFKTDGAAFARVVNEGCTFGAFFLLAYVTAHRIYGPLAWLVAKIPGMKPFLKARLPGTTARLGGQLARVPGAVHVEVSGSARDPKLFKPGSSDLDFLVTTRATGARLVDFVRRCDRVAGKPTWLGSMTAQVVDPDVLGWTRRAGHPVLATRYTRILSGDPIDPPIDAESAREWALTHAFTLAARIQRHALEDRRENGVTRSDLVAKNFRYLLARLYPNSRDGLSELRERGFELPLTLAEGKAPAWFSSALSIEILRATHQLVTGAFEDAARGWSVGPETRVSPAWLRAVKERVRPRAIELVARFHPLAVELTPTGPTDDDPLLALVVNEWSREEWSAWLRTEFQARRFESPFRSYPRPLVVPKAVLDADTFVEHAGLFHVSRAGGSIDLFGATGPSRATPAAVLHRAALRETLHALVRIPREASKVAAMPVWRSSDAGDGPLRGGASRHRIAALLSGRLAGLSLLLDTGSMPPDRAQVERAYTARFDDSLAALIAENPVETSGARVAAVLDDWARARVEKLRALKAEEAPPPSVEARSALV